MTEIKLGSKVKCKITGFIGVAVAKTEYLNGCIQYEVAPKVKKNNEIVESVAIDSQSLEVIGSKKKKIEKEDIGGSMRKGFIQRGY